MHIVHILTRLLRAGSEENTILTARGQIDAGHRVTFLFGPESNPEPVRQKLPEAEFVEIPDLIREISPLRDFAGYRQMTAKLRTIAPDVVHTHQSKAGLTGRFAARSAGVPLIIHGVHILPYLGASLPARLFYTLAEMAAAQVTHGYIHVSEGMRRATAKHRIGRHVPHAVIQSGFDLEKFSNSGPPSDLADLTGADKPLVLVLLAAFEPRKNQLALLDAIAPILRGRPDLCLLFAGEGEMEGKVREKIAEIGLGDQVRMLGYRTDPEKIMALADICLFCSVKEGLPRSVLQYVAVGKPIVMFDIYGLEELVQDGTNARVVPELDWEAFSAALSDMIADEALREDLAAGAKRTDLSKWNWRTMGPRSIDFYKSVASGRVG